MSGWSNEDVMEATKKRDGVARLVAMEENDLEGQEAEVAGIYSSTETSNQTSNQEVGSIAGRKTFQLDVETMDLEELAKPVDTMELVAQASTDSPIKCNEQRRGQERFTPKSVLQSSPAVVEKM